MGSIGHWGQWFGVNGVLGSMVWGQWDIGVNGAVGSMVWGQWGRGINEFGVNGALG